MHWHQPLSYIFDIIIGLITKLGQYLLAAKLCIIFDGWTNFMFLLSVSSFYYWLCDSAKQMGAL